MERGAHMNDCRCTPIMNRINCVSSGSLNTHQILVQWVQPFLRWGKEVRTQVITVQMPPPPASHVLTVQMPAAHTQNFSLLKNCSPHLALRS